MSKSVPIKRIALVSSKRIFIIGLILVWIFSGWPVVWQSPRIPPEAQEVKAKVKPLKIGHKIIKFIYTDDNANENLIIKTNKATYIGLAKANVYFSVTNIGDKTELVNLQAYFPENKGNVKKIERWQENVPYEVDVPDYGQKSYFCEEGWEKVIEASQESDFQAVYLCQSSQKRQSCDKLSEDEKTCYLNSVPIGSHKETRYKNDWQEMNLLNSSLSIKQSFLEKLFGKGARKKLIPSNFRVKKSTKGGYLIKPGQTQYFKMEMQFSPQSSGEFYIEAIGDKKGYGLLDPWWNSSWNYRKPITINNTGNSNTLTNYQVLVNIDNTNTNFWNNVKSDGGDVRFTNNADPQEELNYYMQKWDYSGQSAKFWVEVDSIASSSNTTIYMYYGNASASTTSSGTNTFVFFDDFEDGNINGWNTYSSGQVQIYNGGADGSSYSILKTSNNDPNGGYATFSPALSEYELIWWGNRINNNGGSQNRWGVEDSNYNGYGPQLTKPSGTGNMNIETRSSGSGGNGDVASATGVSKSANTWYEHKFRRYGNGNFVFELYDSSGNLMQSVSGTDTTYTGPFDRILIHGGYEFLSDEFRLRKYSNPDPSTSVGSEETINEPITNQLHFRWRDDSTDLNTSGGWLAVEDSNSISDIAKNNTYRIRIEVANEGSQAESAARTYELQWGEKTGSSCADISTWTGVADASDEFDMVNTTNIDPDGESTSQSLLVNSEDYTYTSGEGRDIADTTGLIGPLSGKYYTELEYSFKATDDAVTGATYCFRLYDATAGSVLDEYAVYPEVTISSVTTNLPIGEYGTVTLSGNATTTVNLSHSYTDLVVVASPRYAPTADVQRAPRITAKTSNSFDIKVDNYDGNLTGTTTVDWIAMEAGSYTIPDGGTGTKVIAGTKNVSTVFCNGTWGQTEVVNFSPSFDSDPAILHTVASNNDASWTVSYVNDGTSNRDPEPTASQMGLALNRSFASCTHGAEDIDYIAFDTGHGTNNSVDFDAVIGDNTVSCCNTTGYATNFSSSFSTAPEVYLIAQMGEDGGNGGYAVTYTGTAVSATTHYGSIDEDGPSADRTHTDENVAVIAFDASSGTIIGNKISLDQTTYRFYDNADSVQPTTAKAAENTAITGVADTDILRIRMAVQVGLNDLLVSTQAFKLQYGQGSDCSAISTWTDVDSAGGTGIWRGYDNATPADGASITSSLLNSQSNALESYEEQNNSVNNPSAISEGSRGEWDWVVQNNGAPASTDYCFRMVTSDGSVIQYTHYPKLTTAGGTVVSVSVSDGKVAYGIIPADTSKSTCTSELNDAQTVTNDGNVTENFNIRGQNSANWTLASSAGNDQYVHEFLNGSCSTFSGGTALTNSDQSLATGISQNNSITLNLQIHTPTFSSVYTQQSVDVIITAVQQ